MYVKGAASAISMPVNEWLLGTHRRPPASKEGRKQRAERGGTARPTVVDRFALRR